MPIFAWNVPLVSIVFLKRALVFPILLFPSISLHCSFKKAFLSLLDILGNSAFRWVYLNFSPLPFTSLLFSVISKASSDNHFAFVHFFFNPWVWKIPWRREWLPTPVCLPGEFHGQRSLVGCSPGGLQTVSYDRATNTFPLSLFLPNCVLWNILSVFHTYTHTHNEVYSEIHLKDVDLKKNRNKKIYIYIS